MINKLFYLSLLTLLVAFGAVDSPAETGFSPKVEFTHERSDLPVDAKVHFGRLDNGLRYAIMPNTEPPGRVSLRLYVGAGSINETEAQRGLAHFLEHMAFKGSENYSPGELVEFLQTLGMAFGPDTNAHTGFDETVYKLELPENTDAFTTEGLQVLRDYADKLLIEPAEIESERGVILSEKRDRDSTGFRRMLALWSFVAPDSIIPERFPIGLRSVIETADRALFVDFYETWYRADNMVLVVVGDVDPAAFEAKIEEKFASMDTPTAPMPEVGIGDFTQPEFAARLHSDREAPATRVSILSGRPYQPRPDSEAQRFANLKESLALNVLNRRFARIADEPEAPFSSGVAYQFDFLEFFEIAGVDVTTRPEDWAAALTVAENELRRALEHGFTEGEVAEALANLRADARNAVAAATTRRSRNLSDALMRSIASDRVFLSPEANLALIEAFAENVEVTAINAAFRELWSEEGRSVFVSGNLSIEDPEEALGEAFLTAAAAPVTAPDADELIPWPYEAFGLGSEVRAHAEDEALGIHQLVFENGLRLNFKQTDYEAGTVRVVLRIGSGTLTLDESEMALGLLASASFVEGGLGAYNLDQLQRVFAGRTVSAHFDVSTDHFSLGGVTTPEDLEFQLQLIAAYLTDPGFRPEAFARAQRQIPELYRQLVSTVDGVMSNDVMRAISGGSPRFGYPEKVDVMDVPAQAVEAFLRPALSEAYLELSIVGDVDFEDAKNFVQKTIGALPARAEAPADVPAVRGSVQFPEVTPALELEASDAERVDVENPLRFTVDSDLPRATAAVFWPTNSMPGRINESRQLNLAANILRDRLRREIREELGEAYSPSAFNHSNEVFEGFGYFRAANGVDPGGAERMALLIRRIAADLVESGTSEEEFERAHRPLIRFLEEYRRDNSYWLSRVLFASQVHPEHLDWARTIVEDYASMTPEQVSETIRKYLTPESALLVLIEPAEGIE